MQGNQSDYQRSDESHSVLGISTAIAIDQSTKGEAELVHEIPAMCTADWVFLRYQAVRPRLPQARFAQASVHCRDLAELVDRFDAFLFDSFGVLNIGETRVPGARERLQALRQAGKRVAVLTNAATGPLSALVGKYAKLGFDFSRNEIVSSREILSLALARYDQAMTWGIAAPEAAAIDELGVKAMLLDPSNGSFEAADGFILLSSQAWTGELQLRLQDALIARRRPLLIGNPDLAAPRDTGFSLEPGTYAHALAHQCGVVPEFFGKPFDNAFNEAVRRIGKDLPLDRIAMVGDTLHTDILGGAAAGLGTVLVTDHGVLQSLDLETCIDASGIVPDFIVPSI